MKTWHKWLLFIGVPMVAVLFYYGLWATDMYVSQAEFSLRSPEGNGSVELLALFGQGGSSTTVDAHVVQRYIESSAMALQLEKELNLKKHYQNTAADSFTRLKSDPTQEEFVAYWGKQISVNYDQASSILTLTVKAFDAAFAQRLCRAILAHSEALVNKLRERSMEDSLSLSRHEVKRAEQRLADAREQLRRFRELHHLLDPVKQAGAVQELVTKLEEAAVKVRTELAEARSFMREDSPHIVALKARQQALTGQILREQGRMTGEGADTINTVAAQYESLVVEHEFAQKQYTTALASLEGARVRAESQSRYLVAFVKPTLPEEALWPRRWYSIGVSFLVVLLAFSLGSLTLAAIREHAGV